MSDFSYILGAATGAGGLAAIFVGTAGAAVAGGLALGVPGLLSLAVTVFIAVLIAFFVLAIRQALVVVLLVLAPLAIVAWILPNTEKFWKLWWESFSKVLLMYPMIILLVAGGKVAAMLIASGQTPFSLVLAILCIFGPYFLIPKTFQLAGSAFANISGIANNRSKGVFDRLSKYRQESGARHRERQGRKVVAKRADWQNQLQTNASNRNKNFVSRRLAGAGARVVGGYNIQAASSARQAMVGKELNDQIATGRDEEIRGLTVNKKAALAGQQSTLDAATGQWTAGDWREKDGVRQFQSLGGNWVNESAVDAGQRRWGNDAYAQQAALSYEMRKANTDEQIEHLATNYNAVAKGWGLSDNQAGGAWIGAAFENQNQHLEFKHTNWKDGQMSADGARNFVSEVYERKGSYPLAQMNAKTVEALGKAYDMGDDIVKAQVQSVAETFVMRGGSGQSGRVGDGEDAQPVFTQGGTPSSPQVSTPGAGHVAEEVKKLAQKTGVIPRPPGGA